MPKVGSTHYAYTAAGKKAAAAARKAGKGKSKPKPQKEWDVQPIFGGQTQVKGIKKETSRGKAPQDVSGGFKHMNEPFSD